MGTGHGGRSLGFPSVVANPLSLPARLWREYGKTLVRFSRVSMVNVFIGQSLLFLFHSAIGWPGAFANMAAVAISSWPAYWLSRHYVWEQEQGGHTVGEIAPFWMLSLAGLFLSNAVGGVVAACAFGMSLYPMFAVRKTREGGLQQRDGALSVGQCTVRAAEE